MEYLNHTINTSKEANPVFLDKTKKRIEYDPEFFKDISKETQMFFFRWIYFREYESKEFDESCKKAVEWYKKKGYSDRKLIDELQVLMKRCWKYEADIMKLVFKYL